MHSGLHSLVEQKPRTAMVREGAEHGGTGAVVTNNNAHCGFQRTPAPRKNYKDIKWEEIRCHNCSGIGHMKRNCPSPRRTTRGQPPAASHESPEPTVLHVKAHSQEMSIHLTIQELEICAVLDSGARRSVLPLHHYNAIHSNARPSLQPSTVKTLLGVGPGDVPVIGEAYIPVQINNRQVSVLFLVADIAGEEALLGHPFLVQAQARLDFGNSRIVLFGEEVPYFHAMSRPRTHAVRVARTVVVEAGLEYVIRGNTHIKEHLQGEVMLSPTKGFVEKHINPGNTAVTIKRGVIAGFLQPAEAL